MIRLQKKLRSAALAALLLLPAVLCPAPPADAGPGYSLIPKSFQFDEVLEGVPAATTFILKNSGDSDLVVHSVASS
jgi:hypothetical protein